MLEGYTSIAYLAGLTERIKLGMPLPSWKDRYERLEETLQIFKQGWAGDMQPYQGKHYQLDELLVSPMPLSKPHPPILVGGEGEKKTLRIVV